MRVEAGGGLVEEEDVGSPDQGGREREPLVCPPERRRTVVPANRSRRAGRERADGGGRGIQAGEVGKQPRGVVPVGSPPDWSMTPTRARCSAPALCRVAPVDPHRSRVGATEPDGALDAVVLPAPLGPRTAVTARKGPIHVIPSSAAVAPNAPDDGVERHGGSQGFTLASLKRLPAPRLRGHSGG